MPGRDPFVYRLSSLPACLCLVDVGGALRATNASEAYFSTDVGARFICGLYFRSEPGGSSALFSRALKFSKKSRRSRSQNRFETHDANKALLLFSKEFLPRSTRSVGGIGRRDTKLLMERCGGGRRRGRRRSLPISHTVTHNHNTKHTPTMLDRLLFLDTDCAAGDHPVPADSC